MSLAEKQQALIEDLNHLPDPHERLAALAGYVPAVLLPLVDRGDELLVPGCVSRVWLHCSIEQGLLRIRCAGDSPMVASLAALLCHLYTGATPREAADIEPSVWQACGLSKILSPTRLNGLQAIRNRIRQCAQNSLTQPPRIQ